ncbi:hypothetical protein M8J76_015342 [Diaphorina citri]|nr:hypothetical protein M8J75_003651 [Diaphorina citri]KAI5745903.1 hypothetical protein M8J76_015342 [Diaphorina citri]
MRKVNHSLGVPDMGSSKVADTQKITSNSNLVSTNFSPNGNNVADNVIQATLYNIIRQQLRRSKSPYGPKPYISYT